ncbi:helix-turn-helix domain-containing protein [Pseudorhodoferax sp. Leaf274]|uniref:helix-turn-helix domain-containing protein n=1 Tax=Pseudorhodoferax sp. Leaf274 TaxID=1736318 RepID=UPI0007024520|nr:helix-turn-helix domain-containing protein [Pseudorhodoferax sp. Leaf274]KQP49522.1 DNA-binding protein [Pseudorhodoferax sp. Leaf274]
MTPSVALNTDAVAPRDRAPQWREWIWRQFGGLETDLYGDTSFDGRLWASQAGDVVLTRLESGRHRVLRSADMARRDAAAYLKIVAPWQGGATVQQRGRAASAQAGGWIIYDTTEGYEIDNPRHNDHLIVMLPKTRMAERGVRLDPLMARHVGGANGISRVALETMRNTYLELPAMSETAARGAGELIMQLVQLSLLELAGQGTAMTLKEALHDRIRDHVARHLRDPALSIEQIATALNCSKRHLHNAFAQGDQTLASYIQQQRLQACIQELRQPPLAGRSITDIALAWGFSNMSHFARVFREHTGMSPSEFRQAARDGAG